MNTREEIETAYRVLEDFLTQTEWSEEERDALKLAVINAILIKRQKRKPHNR